MAYSPPDLTNPIIVPEGTTYPVLFIKRGTRAEIEAAKTASGLLPAEPYLITDESRLAVGTGANSYSDFAKLSEVTDNKTGFVNRTDSTLSFTDATRTFTIAPAVTSFEFYSNGIQYTKTSAQTVTITDTEGQWFIYFNSSGVLTATQTFTPLIITEYAFASVIYWDATNNSAILIGDERHGCIMDSQTHLYLHNTHGSAIDSPMGLAITNIVADGSGSLATHAQVGVSGGGLWDEDIEHVIATLTAPASLPVFYLTGAGLWRRKTATAYPILYGITGTRANYNLLTTGTWTVEEVTSNQYTLSHVFATNDPNQPVIVIAGQDDYSTLTLARENALVELQNLYMIGLPTQEFVALATLIIQTNNGYTNVPKCRIRTTDAGDAYVDWRNTRVGGGGNAATVGWGNITGTLASQIDLQAALNAKENSLGNPASDGQVLSSTVAGVRSWMTVSGGIDTISYDNRGTLRSLESGTKIVDGLGLFRWESGSTEPDDDESCFATTNGRWLLEAAHWDVVDSWQLPDNEVRDIQLESHEDRLQYQEARILYGTAVSNITSLSANTQTSFTGIIVGATTADRVIVIPPNKLTMNTSFFARVTEDNTVTVYLNNPSSSSATLVAGIFLIALIKEIV